MSDYSKVKEHILLVDTDTSHCQKLTSYLEMHSYFVTSLHSREEVIDFLLENSCDLIVSEALFLGESALEFCKKIYENEQIPFIFLSVVGQTSDKVLGLEFGADDYIEKPCDNRELLARIKAVLRRSKKEMKEKTPFSEMFLFEGWTLNTNARHVLNPKKEIINLSGAEYKLLYSFILKPHEVISREELTEILQGYSDNYERNPFDRSIDVQISRLRTKLNEKQRVAKFIKTVRGDGYVFTAKVSRTLA